MAPYRINQLHAARQQSVKITPTGSGRDSRTPTQIPDVFEPKQQPRLQQRDERACSYRFHRVPQLVMCCGIRAARRPFLSDAVFRLHDAGHKISYWRRVLGSDEHGPDERSKMVDRNDDVALSRHGLAIHQDPFPKMIGNYVVCRCRFGESFVATAHVTGSLYRA